jgi:hypothetical protein
LPPAQEKEKVAGRKFSVVNVHNDTAANPPAGHAWRGAPFRAVEEQEDASRLPEIGRQQAGEAKVGPFIGG